MSVTHALLLLAMLTISKPLYAIECIATHHSKIQIEVGKSYFVQKEKSNYNHLMVFFFYPDSAHDNKEEVEEDFSNLALMGMNPIFFIHHPYGPSTVLSM